MKKRALRVLACLAICATLAGPAYATESGVGVNVSINGTALEAGYSYQVLNGQTYIACMPIVSALYPDATAVQTSTQTVITAPGLTLTMPHGAKYVEANGRCLYVPSGVKFTSGQVQIPVLVLCQALGASITWDATVSNFSITAGSGPIASGDSFYNADDLYWLSRIINAESGNQSMEGKIAVGNVVLNRVASSRFPNTVYGVIFQRNQFTPASTGTVNRTPNAESVIAAKLCLEGANTAGNALFFVNPRVSPNSWAARNCTYVATIGAHAFFA